MKSGFVNIIGNPNVGKSTLMNRLVGERISIITSKAQTTRHRIMGIVNGRNAGGGDDENLVPTRPGSQLEGLDKSDIVNGRNAGGENDENLVPTRPGSQLEGLDKYGDFQIVYSDTPGILRPGYRLQESMMRSVRGAVQDADVILYVTDTIEAGTPAAKMTRTSTLPDLDHNSKASINREPSTTGTPAAKTTRTSTTPGPAPLARNAEVIESIRASGIPTIVVINKIDLSTPEAVGAMVSRWQELLPEAQVVTASALVGFNTEGLLGRVLELLPEGDPYYDRDALTDRSLRFFASEIIREKILLNYSKEVPYSVEVVIEEYREEPAIDRIRAVIYVSRASQKGIIIGHRGAALKKTGTAARRDLEDFLGKKVFLELFVKVADNWRNNDAALKRFGYEE